jgi:hypothetical protein
MADIGGCEISRGVQKLLDSIFLISLIFWRFSSNLETILRFKSRSL